jgi:hypothetical protein
MKEGAAMSDDWKDEMRKARIRRIWMEGFLFGFLAGVIICFLIRMAALR